MERIWNKSELEQMDEWRENNYRGWVKNRDNYIANTMIGNPVQWCKDQGYTVTDEMIAKELKYCTHKYLKTNEQPSFPRTCISCGKVEPSLFDKETELVQEAVTQASDKLKERLDKGEIGVTLGNGNPSFEEWLNKYFAKPKMKLMYKTFYNGKEYSEEELIKRYKKAYRMKTEPKKEPKPLEGYKKWYGITKNKDSIKIIFAKNKPNDTDVFWYSEKEVIILGLTI